VTVVSLTSKKRGNQLNSPPSLDLGDITWQRPSPRLWRLRIAEIGSVAVPVALIGGGIGLAKEGAALGGGVFGGAVVLAAIALFMVRNRYKAWRYYERGEDLIVSRGVLFRRLSVVPYGRMQFVDVTAGPFERAYHLATLRMHTAAAASDARIPGLEVEEAARLRDRLATLGEAMAAGL
jgi:membrane protein YdbS with pleckstrin-like domain